MDQDPNNQATSDVNVGRPQSSPDLNKPSSDAAPSNVSSTSMQKADVGKRIVAYLIDAIGIGLVTGILSFVPFVGALIGWVGGIAYMLLRDGLDFDFMDGRSVGKKIMKLRPVRLDGQPMDMVSSLKRNWVFAVPLLPIVEAILMFSDNEGRRIGDKVGETMVIEVDS